jgi:hypothetical protein
MPNVPEEVGHFFSVMSLLLRVGVSRSMCFEGCLPLMLGDTPHEIAAGEFYMFASKQPHAYRNDGAVVAWFVRNVVI